MSIKLIETDFGLALIDETKPKQTPLIIDFSQGKIGFRQQRASKHNEALGKALNLKKYPSPTVIDTTAGLGQDAFILATLGCKVVLLERNPMLYKLLNDGLERAKNTPQIGDAISRMRLLHTDAVAYLQNLTKENYPDIIYCDPMFPEREKAAQVKKNMQLLQGLVGPDLDSEKLLAAALEKALKRRSSTEIQAAFIPLLQRMT